MGGAAVVSKALIEAHVGVAKEVIELPVEDSCHRAIRDRETERQRDRERDRDRERERKREREREIVPLAPSAMACHVIERTSVALGVPAPYNAYVTLVPRVCMQNIYVGMA